MQWWVFFQSTGSCLSIVWERIVVQSWGKKVMGGRERAIASVHWNYQWSHRLIKSLRLCRERTRLRWLLWKFTAAKWSYTNRFQFWTARRWSQCAAQEYGSVCLYAVKMALTWSPYQARLYNFPASSNLSLHSERVHAIQCDTITVWLFRKLCGPGIWTNEIWMGLPSLSHKMRKQATGCPIAHYLWRLCSLRYNMRYIL